VAAHLPGRVFGVQDELGVPRLVATTCCGLGDTRTLWGSDIAPLCEGLAVCLSFADVSWIATFCFVAEIWGMVFRGAALPKAGAGAVKFPSHGPGRIAASLTGI